MWRIGILTAGPAFDHDAFRDGLREVGYVEGQNVVIEFRYGAGPFETLDERAAGLVRGNVDVIVAAPSEAIRAAQRATSTIPIVMAFSGDPVRAGLVASLARPGRNTTGLSSIAPELARKRLEFLRTVSPDVSRVAFLVTAGTLRQIVDETVAAGRALGVHVSLVTVHTPRALDDAFAAVKRAQAEALIIDLVLHEQRGRIADFALKNRLPAISGPGDFAAAGALMTYGANYADLFRRAAFYVDRILKGAKPAELPIEQPTKFELIINLKTAKALGLTIPQSLLLRADQVIE